MAGRATTLRLHPLTAKELGADFDLACSLESGQLPVVQVDRDKTAARAYLRSYVHTYLREEVQQEGLTRNLGAFSRFLEAASFSQGTPLKGSRRSRSSAARVCVQATSMPSRCFFETIPWPSPVWSTAATALTEKARSGSRRRPRS